MAQAISSMTASQRWQYALKPKSWPKILVPALLGQILGVAAAGTFSWKGALIGAAFTVADLVYVVLLNDWGDQHVDAIKRRMFPKGCSPKTIPDGILPARHLLIVGLTGAAVALAVAVAGAMWIDRPWLVPMVAAALFVFWTYTFGPIKLNYRGGGEILETLGVGLMMPWVNAYAQSGVLFHPVLWVLFGFTMLALASALASGLSDEESDRAGGKRTFTTMFGNRAIRRGVDVLVGGSLLAWGVASVLHPSTIPWWVVTGGVVVALLFTLQMWRSSRDAVTNAFKALGRYKLHLHRAIWYGATVLALLLGISHWDLTVR